jgi:hypothetical protein
VCVSTHINFFFPSHLSKVRELRAIGCNAIICGLSANDVEVSFLEAGANAFLSKPFPCRIDALHTELLRIIYDCGGGHDDTGSKKIPTEQEWHT